MDSDFFKDFESNLRDTRVLDSVFSPNPRKMMNSDAFHGYLTFGKQVSNLIDAGNANEYPSPETFIGSYGSREESNYHTDYESFMKVDYNPDKCDGNSYREIASSDQGSRNANAVNYSSCYSNSNNNININLGNEIKSESPFYSIHDYNDVNYSSAKSTTSATNSVFTPEVKIISENIISNSKNSRKQPKPSNKSLSKNNNVKVEDININTNNSNNDNVFCGQKIKKNQKSKFSNIKEEQASLYYDENNNNNNNNFSSKNSNSNSNTNTNSNYNNDYNCDLKDLKLQFDLENENENYCSDLSLQEIQSRFGTSSTTLSEMQSKLVKLQFLEHKRGKDKDKDKKKADKDPIKALIKQTKEEIKMEKNRISAKRSRDKQKKRLEELEFLTSQLRQENARLFQKNEKSEKLILNVNGFLSKNLCSCCVSKFESSSLSAQLSNFINKEIRCSHNNTTNNNNYNSNANGNNNNSNSNLIISSSNGMNSFSPLAKLSVFAGILFVICLVGTFISPKKGINMISNGNNSNISLGGIGLNLPNIATMGGIGDSNNKININNSVEANKQARRMLIMNPTTGTYYSNYDFSDEIDMKNYDNLKAINRALSNKIEFIDKPKILFETYKEIKSKNITSLSEKEYKEILR